jgi:hypothetical protein
MSDVAIETIPKTQSADSVPCLYILIEDPPSPTYLQSIDYELRQVYKTILRLHSCTSTGFMHSRKRDGGLGLPRLEHLVPLALLRGRRALAEIEDSLIGDITEPDYHFQRMTLTASSLGSFWPVSLNEFNQLKCRLKAGDSNG